MVLVGTFVSVQSTVSKNIIRVRPAPDLFLFLQAGR